MVELIFDKYILLGGFIATVFIALISLIWGWDNVLIGSAMVFIMLGIVYNAKHTLRREYDGSNS